MKNKIKTTTKFQFFPTSIAMCKIIDLETAAVFGRIWSYCYITGVCFASKATIGQEVGLSVKTVERRINKLLEKGFIVDESPGKRNRTHIYTITSAIEEIDENWKKMDADDEDEKDEDLGENEPEVVHEEFEEMELFSPK